ncbi:glycosyltransferase [Pseudescherichia sp.]|jgi:GT2 family glycosyltransferase|uniref:glycosyltransferase n=1 Tax=Pseudescherichia sp. TaxID=2055881 RepID=UPI00289ABCFC|nr:glycosyltransferase [Pseudescherichia sp.]
MSMARPALVSIIIPTYKTTWFEQALASAMAQDYPNCEIIVSDDSPHGEPGEIVKACQGKSRHPIIYSRNQPALGDVSNHEKCFRESKGKYIKLFSDDDLLAPDCVSELVSAIEASDEIRIATSRRIRINAQNKAQPDIPATASPVMESSVIHGDDFFAFQQQHAVNFIGEPCTVLMHREDIVELMDMPDGLFSLDGELMIYLEDLTLFSKVLRKGHIAYVTKPLSSFRISRSQKSEQARAEKDRSTRSRERYQQFVAGLAEERNVKGDSVRVAPLHSPKNFVYQDIYDAMTHDLKQRYFAHWLGARTLLPVQENLIDGYLTQNGLSTTLLVVVNATDASDATLAATLASLPQQTRTGLTLETLVIGDTAPAGVSYLAADRDSKIAAFNTVITETQSDWLIFVDAGTEFHPSGLTALTTTLTQAGELLAVYCDESFTLDGRKVGAKFRPDFNLDLLLSAPANMAHRWLWRREVLQAAGGFEPQWPGAYELDLTLKIIETQGFNALGHLGEPLLHLPATEENHADEIAVVQRHLNNRGYANAEVEPAAYGNLRLRYHHAGTPLVSLVVIGDEDAAALMSCVLTLIEKTAWLNYELIMVVNDRQNDETQRWLDSVVAVDPARIRVVKASGEWRYATRVNLGAAVAQGEYLCLMHSGVAIVENDWLHNLLNHGERPEVGIVGGKQVYADGTIRHAGYVLGVNGVAGEAFYGMNDVNKGHMHRLHADQNYSAVSGDFMLVRRDVFINVNGMDETLHHHSDVDFCLRVRQQGYLTVWTPYARVLRSVTANKLQDEKAREKLDRQAEQDDDELYRRWMPLIANDPAYNVNLSLTGEQFNVCPDSLLSWRPLDWKPLPVVLPHMGDFAGCGYYRIIKPFEAMRDAGIVDGKLSETFLSVPYMARYKPDSIIMQRQITAEFHEWARIVGKRTDVFKVFELDDYLPNIPIKNQHRVEFGNDIMKMLRKSVGYMDRFVVSTEPLAEAFANIHPDIVVRKNRLSYDWWDNLASLRGQGDKPRVGWAGGSSHTGDLEMIFDVIKAFADEVDWIFFGMCPPKLRPYVKEFHFGVDIELYPKKLASLNLDLALAPVEDNHFNACKSNLRLLEYGACAIPVICSDVPCYRGSLPATRVRNRFKDWQDAIRMHLADPQASAQMGRALYQAIRSDYMLDTNAAAEWARAWLPG